MAASQVLLLLVRRASLRFPKIIHRLPLPLLTSSFHRPTRSFSAISSSSNAHQQQTSTAEEIDLNEEIAKLEKQRENVARLVTTRAREQEELSLDLQQQTPLAAASECTNVTDLEIDTGSETEVEGPESAVATGGVHMNHPWDEWNAFLDVLHQKDYFKDVPQSAVEGEGSSSFMVSTWIKHAISEFGHDRDDIIRSLSKRHIRMMVNVGCPSLDRKVVNASKRLRVYCETPEDEVCQQCKLKAFCTRAFAEPAPKIDAGTCDVVRVLYSYALNASPYAESQVAFPVGVTKSACQLLREVVNLSASPKKPDVRKNRSVDQSRGVKKTFDRQNSESRPGDWSCPNCEFLNFSRNQECKDCGTVRESAQQPLEPGDWECPGCACACSNLLVAMKWLLVTFDAWKSSEDVAFRNRSNSILNFNRVLDIFACATKGGALSETSRGTGCVVAAVRHAQLIIMGLEVKTVPAGVSRSH